MISFANNFSLSSQSALTKYDNHSDRPANWHAPAFHPGPNTHSFPASRKPPRLRFRLARSVPVRTPECHPPADSETHTDCAHRPRKPALWLPEPPLQPPPSLPSAPTSDGIRTEFRRFRAAVPATSTNRQQRWERRTSWSAWRMLRSMGWTWWWSVEAEAANGRQSRWWCRHRWQPNRHWT